MLVVLRFSSSDDAGFAAEAARVLAILAARAGYVGGRVVRAYDDPTQWSLVTEWDSVGAYRRALGTYEVKAGATPFLSAARPEPSAYEVLAEAGPGEAVRMHDSDRSITSQP